MIYHSLLIVLLSLLLLLLLNAVTTKAQVCTEDSEHIISAQPDTCAAFVSDDNNFIMSVDEDAQDPVQVFIMMGQSNMLGFGSVGTPEKKGTLRYLMENQGKYAHLKNDDDEWVELGNVRYVHVMHDKGKMQTKRNEWLKVREKHKFFGPELGFGHVIGPYLAEKKNKKRILLLKSCIGNRSLGWDLLPPGSPQFEHNGKIHAGYKDSPSSWEKGTTPVPIKWYAGKQYDDDVGMCKKVLGNLEKYYPGAQNNYEIAGFVWWQGHKDNNPALAGRYEENLVRLIHSLRDEFNAPNAKFVSATVGFDGPAQKGNFVTIANAQLAVDGEAGNYPEFKGNVKTIDARPFWRTKNQSPTGQHHHYNQNAETFYEVGNALGEAMVELLQQE